MHKVAPSSSFLSALVSLELTKSITDKGLGVVVQGINVTAESFYSSQGRIDDNFHDRNGDLIPQVIAHYGEQAKSMEMESFTLLHLAKSSKEAIHATAAAIVVANRRSAKVVEHDTLERLELDGGHAILKAITSFEI